MWHQTFINIKAAEVLTYTQNTHMIKNTVTHEGETVSNNGTAWRERWVPSQSSASLQSLQSYKKKTKNSAACRQEKTHGEYKWK